MVKRWDGKAARNPWDSDGMCLRTVIKNMDIALKTIKKTSWRRTSQVVLQMKMMRKMTFKEKKTVGGGKDDGDQRTQEEQQQKGKPGWRGMRILEKMSLQQWQKRRQKRTRRCDKNPVQGNVVPSQKIIIHRLRSPKSRERKRLINRERKEGRLNALRFFLVQDPLTSMFTFLKGTLKERPS